MQVVQADGGTRCACINAAMLALADAGEEHQQQEAQEEEEAAAVGKQILRGSQHICAGQLQALWRLLLLGVKAAADGKT